MKVIWKFVYLSSVLDLGAQGECVSKMDSKSFKVPSSSGQVTAELHTVCVNKSMLYNYIELLQIISYEL